MISWTSSGGRGNDIVVASKGRSRSLASFYCSERMRVDADIGTATQETEGRYTTFDQKAW